MIKHTLDTTNAILHIQPQTALEKKDFSELTASVDSFIAQSGHLKGLIIETPSFPGWESLGAMCAHFQFVRDHHRHIRKVALVTDSVIGAIGEKLASHFISAEIKQFPATALAAAQQWIIGNP